MSSATTQQVGRDVDIGLAHGGAQRRAGPVHVPHRLHEQHAILRASRLQGRRAVAHPALAGELPAVGQQVDHAEADVVAREPVALARVSETADDLHGAADGSRPHRVGAADPPPTILPRWNVAGPIPATRRRMPMSSSSAAASSAPRRRRSWPTGARPSSSSRSPRSGPALPAATSARSSIRSTRSSDGCYAESLSRYRALASVAEYGFAIGDEPAGLLLLSPRSRWRPRAGAPDRRSLPRARPGLHRAGRARSGSSPRWRAGPAAVAAGHGLPGAARGRHRRLGGAGRGPRGRHRGRLDGAADRARRSRDRRRSSPMAGRSRPTRSSWRPDRGRHR